MTEDKSTLAAEVASIDAARSDANQKVVAAYDGIQDELGKALNTTDQDERAAAASKIVGYSASMWMQGIRMAAIAADAQGRIIASIVSDTARSE